MTLDPKFYTPEILKAYAEDQQADPAMWTFATGQPAQIDLLTQRFGVYVEPSYESCSRIGSRRGVVSHIQSGLLS